MMQGTITISLKAEVLDPQGKAVQTTLQALGFPSVQGVRVGKSIVVELDCNDQVQAKEQLRSMCDRLLVNPVIEDYRIEVSLT